MVITVSDDGRGMDGSVEGGGITGMRERALLVDGAFGISFADVLGGLLLLEIEGGPLFAVGHTSTRLFSRVSCDCAS